MPGSNAWLAPRPGDVVPAVRHQVKTVRDVCAHIQECPKCCFWMAGGSLYTPCLRLRTLMQILARAWKPDNNRHAQTSLFDDDEIPQPSRTQRDEPPF